MTQGNNDDNAVDRHDNDSNDKFLLFKPKIHKMLLNLMLL